MKQAVSSPADELHAIPIIAEMEGANAANKLLEYFEGLRADQTLICFTKRIQADRYLNDLARTTKPTDIH